jgi:hypothetical protein
VLKHWKNWHMVLRSHMRRIAQADAVAIRWSDVANERYVLMGSDCLPQVMAEDEQCVLSGDCLCGAKVEPGTSPQPARHPDPGCRAQP